MSMCVCVCACVCVCVHQRRRRFLSSNVVKRACDSADVRFSLSPTSERFIVER